MVDVELVLSAVVLFFLGVLSPGPNFFVVVRTSIAQGPHAGIATGLGVAIGDGLYASAGMMGLSALLSATTWAFALVKITGGVFLLYLGFHLFFRRRALGVMSGEMKPREQALGRFFILGLCTDLANPKTLVFFASIFALVIQPETTATTRALMVASIIGVSSAWRIGLAIAFSRRRVRAMYLRSARVLDRICGIALGAFGLIMITSVRGLSTR